MAATASLLPATTFADEFCQMAIELHCRHSGRSLTWDKNEDDWKNCRYRFCKRRYELFIGATDGPTVLFDLETEVSLRIDDNPAASFCPTDPI